MCVCVCERERESLRVRDRGAPTRSMMSVLGQAKKCVFRKSGAHCTLSALKVEKEKVYRRLNDLAKKRRMPREFCCKAHVVCPFLSRLLVCDCQMGINLLYPHRTK
jgi:hypothetical protein